MSLRPQRPGWQLHATVPVGICTDLRGLEERYTVSCHLCTIIHTWNDG